VGLLFMCFQASIAKQFAFLQRQWANALGGGESDAVIEQRRAAGAVTHQWPHAWGGPVRTPVAFGRYVKLKGGEAFFAPSRQYFARLAGRRA
jgi:hypothetical protein